MEKKQKKVKKNKKNLYIILIAIVVIILLIVGIKVFKKYPKKVKLGDFTKQIVSSCFQDYFENIEIFEDNPIRPNNIAKYIIYKNLKNNIEEIPLQNIIKEAKNMFNVEITEMDVMQAELFEYNMEYSIETQTVKKIGDPIMLMPNSINLAEYAYFINKIYQTSDNTYEICADVISPNDIQDFIDYYSSNEYLEKKEENIFIDSSKFTPFYNLKDFLTLENYKELGTKVGTGKLTIEYEDGRFIIKSYELQK